MGNGEPAFEPGSAGTLERELASLPEIRAARVVTEPSGRPVEIHLVAEGRTPPGRLVEDVRSLARDRLGLEIDQRIVSIVQFDRSEPPSARPELGSLTWSMEGSRATCCVEVLRGDQSGIGEAAGRASAASRARIVAQATLDAVASLDRSRSNADLENAFFAEVGEHRIAVVVLALLSESGEETVAAGSVPVRNDENDAIARATLDAINRRLET